MVKKILSVFVCVMMLGSASLAFAGGTVAGSAPQPCGPYPYSAKPYGPPPVASPYWGDAPFPGMCGGVVALPFLVVGSLLGGNTAGPYGPPPGPGYNYGPPPGPGYNCAQPPCPPGKVYGPPAAGGMWSGLWCGRQHVWRHPLPGTLLEHSRKYRRRNGISILGLIRAGSA